MGRHSDGNGLFLLVQPSGSRSWIARLTIKGQRNKNGKPQRTDFGLGSINLVSLPAAREKALAYRQMAMSGINPRFANTSDVPSFAQMAQQVQIERAPTWKSKKHATQWLKTLIDHAHPNIGALPVDQIGQPEVLSVLSPIWTSKHETARRVAQRIKSVLDVARSKGFRDTENPVTAIKEAGVLPKVKKKHKHHEAMHWKDVPAFYANLSTRSAMAALALRFTCLSGARTSEVLKMRWEEVDFGERLWTCPAERMKTDEDHRVPLSDEMIAIIEPLKAMKSEYVFEGQKRNKPLSNMAMLMLLRRMGIEDVTVHGFRSTFRDWASEVANAPREIAELSLSHKIGNEVEQAYARSDLLERRRVLMERWAAFVTGHEAKIVRLG